jgi:hypothetical protein
VSGAAVCSVTAGEDIHTAVWTILIPPTPLRQLLLRAYIHTAVPGHAGLTHQPWLALPCGLVWLPAPLADVLDDRIAVPNRMVVEGPSTGVL